MSILKYAQLVADIMGVHGYCPHHIHSQNLMWHYMTVMNIIKQVMHAKHQYSAMFFHSNFHQSMVSPPIINMKRNIFTCMWLVFIAE